MIHNRIQADRAETAQARVRTELGLRGSPNFAGGREEIPTLTQAASLAVADLLARRPKLEGSN